MSTIFRLAAVVGVLMLKVSSISTDKSSNVDTNNVLDIVADLQKRLMLQERRIEELENRDMRRRIAFEGLAMKAKNLENSCGSSKKHSIFRGEKQLTIMTKSNLKVPYTIDKHVRQRDTHEQGRRQIIREAESVGFSAYMDHNIDHMAHGHTIKMNQVLLNDGGGYNNTTGIFTVPVGGVYLFTFHYNSHYRKTLVGLFVDGRNEVDAISVPKDATQEMMGGNTAILRMVPGQSVWLEDIIVDDGEIYSTPAARYATFSGVLLY